MLRPWLQYGSPCANPDMLCACPHPPLRSTATKSNQLAAPAQQPPSIAEHHGNPEDAILKTIPCVAAAAADGAAMATRSTTADHAAAHPLDATD